MHLLWDKYCKLGSLWKTFYLILVLLSRCCLLLLVLCKSQTESQFLTNQWKQKTLVCLVTRALVLIVFVFWIGTKAKTATRVRQTFMFSFNMKPCHTFWINLYFSKSHSWKQRLWKTGDGTAMGQRESSWRRTFWRESKMVLWMSKIQIIWVFGTGKTITRDFQKKLSEIMWDMLYKTTQQHVQAAKLRVSVTTNNI